MAFQFTDANVEEIIASGKPVVVDFWATWCGPCMSMAPIIDEVAAEFEGQAVIDKYKVEEESDFASENRVMSLTTILFFFLWIARFDSCYMSIVTYHSLSLCCYLILIIESRYDFCLIV